MYFSLQNVEYHVCLFFTFIGSRLHFNDCSPLYRKLVLIGSLKSTKTVPAPPESTVQLCVDSQSHSSMTR